MKQNKKEKKKKDDHNTVLLPHPTEKNKQINDYLRKNKVKALMVPINHIF